MRRKNDRSVRMSPFELSGVFFLELAVVLAACRLAGALMRPLGQPQVVGEMLAGVLLGPSLFGWLAPELHARLFPAPALAVLHCAAQLGLALYMFVVGLEFDVELIRRRVRSAVVVSWAGIVVPFALGAGLAWTFFERLPLFAPNAQAWEAMVFTGAAMSVTAFPVLARIIHENGLSGTALGTLALAAGSADDTAAWCFLAVAMASFGGSSSLVLLAVGGGLAFALLVFGLLRPLLARHGEQLGLAGTLLLLALAAAYADAIGLHAVFGAFLLGVAMPRGDRRRRLIERLEPLTATLLLPLFFACSGLRTRFDLVTTPAALLLALVVLVAACAGKGLACWAAARWQGEEPGDAIAIGALMNARGTMELILLNIGLEQGLITPLWFSVLVIMAIVTTLMATPLFRWARAREAPRLAPALGAEAAS
jgi:Kef-type K+ transport system membrane component KefB